MKIITFDPNGNNLAFKLYNLEDLSLLAWGSAERIGIEAASYSVTNNEFDFKQETSIKDHSEATDVILSRLVSSQLISNESEIVSCAVKVVHGGEIYDSSVVVTDKVLADINQLASFDPNGNPLSSQIITKLRSKDPNRPVIAVFDTSFYKNMDPSEYLYPLPYRWYNEYGVRKYGYYGTSHRHVYRQMLEKEGRDLNIISCHLGNGGNITAIEGGKAIDTSMGFSPLSGIMMGSRSGDIDPSIIAYIMEKDGKSAHEVLNDLNDKSGFLGVTEMTSEVKDVYAAIGGAHDKAELAIAMFINYVISYIAEYYVKLGKVDALCFTAGIGENAVEIRRRIIEELKPLGMEIDNNANKVQSQFSKISSQNSKVEIYVVPSDEHVMMAIDAKKFVR